jgi:hypothetical protein
MSVAGAPSVRLLVAGKWEKPIVNSYWVCREILCPYAQHHCHSRPTGCGCSRHLVCYKRDISNLGMLQTIYIEPWYVTNEIYRTLVCNKRGISNLGVLQTRYMDRCFSQCRQHLTASVAGNLFYHFLLFKLFVSCCTVQIWQGIMAFHFKRKPLIFMFV